MILELSGARSPEVRSTGSDPDAHDWSQLAAHDPARGHIAGGVWQSEASDPTVTLLSRPGDSRLDLGETERFSARGTGPAIARPDGHDGK